jgi:hypothetical protein
MSDKMPKQHKQDAVNDILKEVAIGLDGARLNKKQQELLDKLKSMVK